MFKHNTYALLLFQSEPIAQYSPYYIHKRINCIVSNYQPPM